MGKACWFILAWLFTIPLPGQTYRLQHLGVEEGLPGSQVFSLLQDAQGYLWFGTDRGAIRYDGEQYLQLTTAEGLADETVYEMCEDRMGNIWFATHASTLSYWDGRRLKPYPYNSKLEQLALEDAPKSGLAISDQGDVYLGSYHKGLIHLDRTGRLSHQKSPQNGYCHSYAGLPLVYAGMDYALAPLPPAYADRGSPNSPNSPNSSTPENRTYTIQQDQSSLSFPVPPGRDIYLANCAPGPKGEWYFILGNQIRCIQDGLLQWETLLPHKTASVFVDRAGVVWIGYLGGGLSRISPSGKHLPDAFPQLAGKTVSAILQDAEGGYWFGTIGQGLYYLPTLHFPYFPLPAIEASPGVLFDLAALSDSFLVVSQERGELNGLRRNSQGQWTWQSLGSTIWGAALESDASRRQIWVAGNSIYTIDSSGQISTFRRDLVGGRVTCMATQSTQPSQTPLLGTNHGLIRFTTRPQNQPKRPAEESRIYSLYQARDGRTWVGTLKGLWELKDSILVRPPWEHPALRKRITSIAELRDGRLVCGTLGAGILLLKEQEVSVYGNQEGLQSNMVNCLEVDQQGILWAGSNSGLQRMDFTAAGSPQLRSFDQQHGMPFLEVSRLHAHGDHLWIGGPQGLARFQTQVLPSTARLPPIFLTGLQANGQSIPLDSPIRLHHSENTLQIHFQGFHYRSQGPLNYRFRLLGLEEAWQYTRDRHANFPALPSGSYRFEVSAANEDGQWSPPEQLQIQIRSPYWQEWWFILLVSSLITGAIAGGIHGRIRQIKARNRKEQALEKWKLRALTARINPHFTFNTLNTIMAYISTEETEAAELYLKKFSRLMRLVLHQSEQDWVPLEEEIELLHLYLDLKQMRFSQEFSYEIQVAPEISQARTQVPSMLVQPLVENAVLHGLLPKGKPGQLKVAFTTEETRLICTVEDDGIGRKAAQKRKAHPGSLHKSAGIGLVHSRLELLGDAQLPPLQIEDLYDATGKPAGTRITLPIPQTQ